MGHQLCHLPASRCDDVTRAGHRVHGPFRRRRHHPRSVVGRRYGHHLRGPDGRGSGADRGAARAQRRSPHPGLQSGRAPAGQRRRRPGGALVDHRRSPGSGRTADHRIPQHHPRGGVQPGQSVARGDRRQPQRATVERGRPGAPDPDQLVAAEHHGRILVDDLQSRRHRPRLGPRRRHGDRVEHRQPSTPITRWALQTASEQGSVRTFSAQFSPDATQLVSGRSDGTIDVWSLPQTTLADRGGTITGMGLSADGTTVATVGTDTTLNLWSARGGSLTLRSRTPIQRRVNDHPGSASTHPAPRWPPSTTVARWNCGTPAIRHGPVAQPNSRSTPATRSRWHSRRYRRADPRRAPTYSPPAP
nr:hypothetical protein [Gordonia bronchialis]